LVRFRFYKPETEKTEPKLKKTEKNRAKLEKQSQTSFFLKNRIEPNPVSLNRFWFF
jgi:hypothetical protein